MPFLLQQVRKLNQYMYSGVGCGHSFFKLYARIINPSRAEILPTFACGSKLSGSIVKADMLQ